MINNISLFVSMHIFNWYISTGWVTTSLIKACLESYNTHSVVFQCNQMCALGNWL